MMYMYDILASVLTGILHLVLYLLLIRHDRLPVKTVILLSIIFTILLGFIVTVTGYPEWNSILLVVFLLSLGTMQNNLSFMQNFYFALMSAFSITFTKVFMLEFLFQLFMVSPFNLYVWTTSLFHLLITILIGICIVFWRKKIGSFAAYIESSRLYPITYSLLFIGFVISLILTTPSTQILALANERFGGMSMTIAFILFLILLLIAIVTSYLAKEQFMQEQREVLNEERLDYVEKLEYMHADLVSFRHDYMNLLLALETSIQAKDLQQIEKVYYDVIAPTSELMNDHELDLVKLASLKIPEVKSVLSVKVIAAQQKGIKVIIDMPHVIEEIRMPAVYFIRALSILVDNAMEEAARSEEKQIQIAFFEMDDATYFIVKNSCQQKTINLQALYKKRYSTKEGKRGYGLFSLKRMVDQMNHVTLETTFTYPYLTQILMMKREK